MFLTDRNKFKNETVHNGYLWVLVVCLLITFSASAGQPTTHISSLNFSVKGLFFYESDKGFPPKKDRIYRTEFNKSKTKYINWELRIKYPKQRRKIKFPIHYKYYNPQGKILTDYNIDSYINAGWNNSHHSGGYKMTWTPGTHKVNIYIAGDMVASSTFEVVSGKDETTPPTVKPNNKIEIPDDLGEL